ncbi:MAG: cytochrome C oxidase subunit IV family protein [Pseudomonadota bacterium]|nr:cytochrome C oxidase subunit IV family protein [Pseudomonadota bacterium]HJO36153.1 cytochrome C oxidase subunit IV family protein [Gammaproteobacteria bacterium]
MTSPGTTTPLRHDRQLWLLSAIFLLLQALLLITWGAHYVPLGAFTPVVNFGIAIIKTLLVAIFFMQLRAESGLVRAAAGLGGLWLLILFTLLLADYLTR